MTQLHAFLLKVAATTPQIDLSPLPNMDPGDRAKMLWRNGLTIAFGLAAAIALLMIVINGFRYITANGEPQKMAEARQGILYAAIGLIVSVSAVAIVTFAIQGVS